MTDFSIDTGAADPRICQPAKCSTSNSSRAKVGNDKSPTIVTPTIMAKHQSRPSPSGTAAVTNAQPGRAEQAPGANSDEAFLSDDEMPVQAGDTKGRGYKTMCSGPIAQSNDLLQSKSLRSMSQQQNNGWHQVSRGPEEGQNDSLSPGGTGRAGKTVHSAQVKPTALKRGPSVQSSLLQSNSSNEVLHDTCPGDPDEDQ